MGPSDPVLKVNDEVRGSQATYRVIDVLRGGGFAQVYRVQNVANQSRWILKLNRQGTADEPLVLHRVESALLSEGITAQRVVKMADRLLTPLEEWRGHVEEEAPGKPHERHTPTELEAVQVALAFAHVLRACARHHIAYVDVKPLDHIFWDQEAGNIRVIDWNISKIDATLDELRQDLLRFCERLPEIFLAIQRDDPTSLHPLGWSLSRMVTPAGKRLSYASWLLLAELSLSWGAPFLFIEVSQGVRALTHIVASWESSEVRGDEYAQLLQGWDSVIAKLEQLRALLDPATRGAEYSDPIARHRPQEERIIQQLRQRSVSAAVATPEWEQSQREARQAAEPLYKEMGGWSGLIFRSSPTIEPVLRAARLLDPLNPRPALAWTALALLKRLDWPSDGAAWHPIIEAIVRQADPERALRSLESQQAILESHLAGWGGDLSPLQRLWKQTFTQFCAELKLWANVEAVRAIPDPTGRLEQLTRLGSANHPLVAELRASTQQEQTQQRNLIELRQKLQQALRQHDNDHSDAEVGRLLDELRALAAPEDEALIRQATAKRESWQKLKQRREQVKQILESSDPAKVALPFFEVKTDPALADLLPLLQRRLESIEKLEKDAKQLDQQISELQFAPSDATTGETTIQQLGRYGENISDMRASHPDSPTVRNLSVKWLSRVSRFLEAAIEAGQARLSTEVPPEAAETRGDALGRLKRSLAALRNLQPIAERIQAAGAGAEPAPITFRWSEAETIEREIQSALNDLTRRQKEQREAFLHQLQLNADFEALESQLSTMPPRLRSELKDKLCQKWRDVLLSKAEAALSAQQPDNALDLAQAPLPKLLVDDPILKQGRINIVKRAKQLRVRQKVEAFFLALPSSKIWLGEAKSLQAELGSDSEVQDLQTRLTHLIEEANAPIVARVPAWDEKLPTRLDGLEKTMTQGQTLTDTTLKALSDEVKTLKTGLETIQHHVALLPDHGQLATLSNQLAVLHALMEQRLPPPPAPEGVPEPDSGAATKEESNPDGAPASSDSSEAEPHPTATEPETESGAGSRRGGIGARALPQGSFLWLGGGALALVLVVGAFQIPRVLNSFSPPVSPTPPEQTQTTSATPESVPTASATTNDEPKPTSLPEAEATEAVQPSVTASAKAKATDTPPAPTGTPTEWLSIGSVLRVNPGSTVFADEELTQPLWVYQNVAATVPLTVTLVANEADKVQVRADLYMYYDTDDPNMTRDANEKPTEISEAFIWINVDNPPGTHIASLNGPQTIAAENVLEGPIKTTIADPRYRIRFEGWVARADLVAETE